MVSGDPKASLIRKIFFAAICGKITIADFFKCHVRLYNTPVRENNSIVRLFNANVTAGDAWVIGRNPNVTEINTIVRGGNYIATQINPIVREKNASASAFYAFASSFYGVVSLLNAEASSICARTSLESTWCSSHVGHPQGEEDVQRFRHRTFAAKLLS